MSERKELAARLRAVAESMERDSPAWDTDDLRAAADLLDPPARGRTVRVRACVAVTRADTFHVSADSGDCDAQSAAYALECAWRQEDEDAGTPAQIRWIEADVPAWEAPPTVEGEVS